MLSRGLQSTMLAWWPLPDGPYPLIDGWAECGIEDTCWVPLRSIDAAVYNEVRATGGREAAALAFAAEHLREDLARLAEAGLCLVSTGTTSWHRPTAEPDGYGEYVRVDRCDECHDGGDTSWPLDLAGDGYHGPRPACQGCRGARKLHTTYEGCPWAPCGPDERDAVEFLALEVADGV